MITLLRCLGCAEEKRVPSTASEEVEYPFAHICSWSVVLLLMQPSVLSASVFRLVWANKHLPLELCLEHEGFCFTGASHAIVPQTTLIAQVLCSRNVAAQQRLRTSVFGREPSTLCRTMPHNVPLTIGNLPTKASPGRASASRWQNEADSMTPPDKQLPRW
jgi:hypothetical protein